MSLNYYLKKKYLGYINMMKSMLFSFCCSAPITETIFSHELIKICCRCNQYLEAAKVIKLSDDYLNFCSIYNDNDFYFSSEYKNLDIIKASKQFKWSSKHKLWYPVFNGDDKFISPHRFNTIIKYVNIYDKKDKKFNGVYSDIDYNIPFKNTSSYKEYLKLCKNTIQHFNISYGFSKKTWRISEKGYLDYMKAKLNCDVDDDGDDVYIHIGDFEKISTINDVDDFDVEMISPLKKKKLISTIKQSTC